MISVVNKIKRELNKKEKNILVGHGYITMKRKDAIKELENKYEVAELETSE